MKRIRTEIEIDAPPTVVWDVLTDLPAYGEWNPHITAAGGEVREGESVDLRVQPSGSRARDLTATVTAADPPRKLQWTGTVLSPWLFEGEHTFELEALGDDRTRLVNAERLSGALVPFVTSAETRLDYDAMNRALARRAETRFAERTEPPT